MKVCLCASVIMLSCVSPARASECSYRLVSEFAFAVVHIQRQREQIKPELSPEMLISTPLRLQRTIEESATRFLTTYSDCTFIDRDAILVAAFSEIAEHYRQSVDFGKRTWQIVSVDPSGPTEAQEKTRRASNPSRRAGRTAGQYGADGCDLAPDRAPSDPLTITVAATQLIPIALR